MDLNKISLPCFKEKFIPCLKKISVPLVLISIIFLLLSILGYVAWANLPSIPEAPSWANIDEDLQYKKIAVSYLEQYINLGRLIVVGVFVTLIVAALQYVVPESRDRFERYKESRQAYSQAKTAVIYLPDKVVNSSDPARAFVLVENAHRKLHFAETFADEIVSRGYIDWFKGKKDCWIPYNYWQIVAVAQVLRSPKVDFDEKSDLKNLLSETLMEVHITFGRKGGKTLGEGWVLKDKEAELCDKICGNLGIETDKECEIRKNEEKLDNEKQDENDKRGSV